MCLAIPGKIKSIDDENIADIDFNGLIKKSSLDLISNAKVGDYVLVHAGYAIEVIDKVEAAKTLELLNEMK